MTQEEYEKAADYWHIKDADSVKMNRQMLLQKVEEYILANNTCALATGTGTFVRCTPIEYSYRDGAFWLFSEGGEKFIGLAKNDNVCLAIYDAYKQFSQLKGMQIMGTVTIVEPFSEEYNQTAKQKKIPLEALKKLSSPMHLLKVEPVCIDYLNSEFKKEGYASRQRITFH